MEVPESPWVAGQSSATRATVAQTAWQREPEARPKQEDQQLQKTPFVGT
jgi:hypothetical protein